jgi:hypothetical protein
MQRPVIAASPGVLAALAAFIAGRPAQPIRLGVEHRIQRFLDRPPNHLPKMVPDPGLVDLDYLAHLFAPLIV